MVYNTALENKTVRIEWIDLAKFVGIFFMVLGHCGVTPEMDIFLHAFHMPIFFFLSGYCAKKKLDVKKKLRTLIVPYFIFGTALYLLWSVIALFSSVVPKYELTYFVDGILWNNATKSPYAGVQWFLTCLFLTELIFYLINRFLPLWQLKLAAITALSVLGYFYLELTDFRLVWALDCAFTALSFYAIGYAVKSLDGKMPERLRRYRVAIEILAFAVLLPVAIITTKKNGYVNMRTLEYGKYFLFYFSACSIVALICIACAWISRIGALKRFFLYRGITYIGRNTLIVLLMNQLYIQCFRFWLEEHVLRLTGIDAYWLYLLLAIAVCVLMVPTAYLFNKYLPLAVGRKIKKEKV